MCEDAKGMVHHFVYHCDSEFRQGSISLLFTKTKPADLAGVKRMLVGSATGNRTRV
jgi:hypothetical protein